MNDQTNEDTLYDKIGGADGVAALVEDFYSRVFADSKLKPYFHEVSSDRLKKMQFEFFSAALDGPRRYQGRTVAHAHQRLKIDRPTFQRFTDHLFETLSGLDLDEDQRYQIIARINLYAEDVMGIGAGIGD